MVPQDDILHILSRSRSLRSIYVITCEKRDSISELDEEDNRRDFLPTEFLQYFVNFYYHHPSTFYDNLDKMSYSNVLWDFVPAGLDPEEEEEMEYELEHEDISDSELQDLGRLESLEVGMDKVSVAGTTVSEDDDMSAFLANPNLFSCKRSMFELKKMPVRATWSSHSDSTIVNAVRFFVTQCGNQFDIEDRVQDECVCGDPGFSEQPCRNCLETPDGMRILPWCPVLFQF